MKNRKLEVVLTIMAIGLISYTIYRLYCVLWIPEVRLNQAHWIWSVFKRKYLLFLPIMWYMPLRLTFGKTYFHWTVRWGITTLALIPYGVVWHFCPTPPCQDNSLYDKPVWDMIQNLALISILQLIFVLPVFLLLAARNRKRETTAMTMKYALPLGLSGLFPIVMIIIYCIVVAPYFGC